MKDTYETPASEGEVHSTFSKNLADYLTFSRLVTGFIILALALMGENAYIVVVLLSFLGAITDIYDGRAARRYLGEGKEGKLGKYDITIDTFFISCIIGYLAFSHITITPWIGIIWISTVIAVSLLTKGDARVLTVFEIVGVISILLITLFYDPLIFMLLIAPGMAFGIIINRRRVFHLLFRKWPDMFSR